MMSFKTLFYFFYFILFSLGPFTPLVAKDLDPVEDKKSALLYFDSVFNDRTVNEAQEITKQIQNIYPPQKYHYIFVGRSLALIKGLFEIKGLELTSLPFRGKNVDINFESYAGQKLKALILEHFSSHLPQPEEIKNKDLVLLDFTVSGAGLRTAKKLLDWYYKGQKTLHTLEVTSELRFFKNYIPRFNGKTKVIRINTDSMMSLHLLNSNFDRYAGHGTFNIYSGEYLEYEPQTELQYKYLKSWLMQKTHKSIGKGFCQGYLI